MAYFKIKLTNITIQNTFKVFYKIGDSPYPFDVGYIDNGGTWDGGTTTIDAVTGLTITCAGYLDPKQIWIKLQETLDTKRFVIRNVNTNDCLLYVNTPAESPTPTPTITLMPTVTPTITPTPTPTITPTASCARPGGLSVFNLLYDDGVTNFTGSQAAACAALPHYGEVGWHGQVHSGVSLTVGEKLYPGPGTSCHANETGYFIVVDGGIPYIIYLLNGTITTYPVGC